MKIDFEQTRAAIRNYRGSVARDFGAEDQTSALMLNVADDVVRGSYVFDADDTDAVSASFVGWTRARNLLVLA